MINIVREFNVKDEARGQFELAYGPGGAWSNLVDKSPGYRGTALLRDIQNPNRFLTVDSWDTLDQRNQMLSKYHQEYSELIDSFSTWTESQKELGVFRVMAEGSVRPRQRPTRRR